MDPQTDGNEPQPVEPEPTAPIRLRWRPTLRDHARAGMFAARRSDLFFGLGVALLLAAVGLVVVQDFVGVAVMVTLAAALLSGALCLPFVWWETRRRPELLNGDVEEVIDDHGVAETTSRYSTKFEWSAYREVIETRHAFFFAVGSGLGFIAKRAISEPDLEVLRRLIAEHGLVRRPRRLRRALMAVGVPLVIVAVAALPLVWGRLSENPRVGVSPAVDGRIVTVHADTDLPDGALLSVEIIQVDEYARSLGAGGPATVESPWIRYKYVSVASGAFDVTFDAGGWPAGRVRVIALFDPTVQMSNVTDRYGSNGEQMSGSNIKDDPEGGRRLEVHTNVTLP